MTSRPRVLVLNHFAAPIGQPGGTRHVELFSRLSGWDYLIVASNRNHLSGQRVSSSQGFATVPTLSYSGNGLRRVLNWASYAVSAFVFSFGVGRVDIVYASSPHLLTGLAGWALAKLRNRPFVLEVRDLWPKILVEMGQISDHNYIYRSLRMLEKFLYRSADQIVIMAPGTQSELENLGISPKKIFYIPNGADPEDFAPKAARHELREKFGFEGIVAIYAGAHGPANGLDYLVDAAKNIGDLPVTIVLVGSGVTKEHLVERVRNEGLRNVRFLDPVPKTEIPDLLHAADIGLHVLADVPTFREAVSPNKVFDYMAASLPIMTNSGGIVANWVLGSGGGVVSEPSRIDWGIRELVGADRDALGRSGRLWLRSHHSRSAMAVRLEDMLGNLRKSDLAS